MNKIQKIKKPVDVTGLGVKGARAAKVSIDEAPGYSDKGNCRHE
ncbi:MAG: hypothetical protein Q8R55_00855 [Candidatus Taylorbacteria bacterium]|nr:hypothetical protein [Candidatus Taylorbacteria bacterium]